ncbi:uncharacterized protein DUF1593 [Breznakibacter xylanolyticus]|uniref:Uncharacterized protein DUF1593 n=1 Tax=Breznakibacter xylanolyticus TaxID=990 RepID=A0A2W7PQN1_9BACT|nr:DUF1593 domain-containing protein [Breznakibacter xylanolyticus]PZX11739.1 uncharacterized protein DUF1593 [Breznakibacter xylanolyticus]
MRASFLVLLLAMTVASLWGQNQQKHRLIVLTDIEADPDDTQSLVRLLLYSNEIDIKGLIATTSCWHRNMVNPQSIKKVVQGYEKVHHNLMLHHAQYPKAEALYALIKQGLPRYGMAGVGSNNDSEGSEWIIRELEKADERPLWISVWGGANTLAQALYQLKQTQNPQALKQLVSRLRVYAISDQDDSGLWLRNNFPDLFYIVSPGDDYGSATWSAINGYISGIDNHRISNTWIAQHIQQGHGSLGALYPDVAWGVEGDTPAFLSLIQNGLSNAEHPDWGGWGGRYELYQPDFSSQKKGGSGVPFEPETRKIWTHAVDAFSPYVSYDYGRAVKPDTVVFRDNKVSLWRWRDDFQNDFAARMDWCCQPYEAANHHPQIVLSHPDMMVVKSGQWVALDAFETTDPDGDSFSFLWFHYPEAGTYHQPIGVEGANNAHAAFFIAPKVDKDETVHFILKVTDRGQPQLSSYKRVIVTIQPS